MTNVIEFNGETRCDIEPEMVLDAAKDKIGDVVVVIGRDEDGDLYFASSTPDGREILWMIEHAKIALMDM